MKKIMKSFAMLVVVIAAASCSDKKEMSYGIDPALAPTSVTTGNISNLSYSSVVVAGAASMNEGIVDRGVFIDTSQYFTTGKGISATTLDSTTGQYTVAIADLTEQTRYYVKSYATSFAGGTIFGEVKNFTTTEAPPQWEALQGVWTVTEDVYISSWYNGQQYDITITGVPNDKFKVRIDGFAPWMEADGHTIYATVSEMTITIPSQELIPGWDAPTYKTWFAALESTTLAENAGRGFPTTEITTNSDGKLEIALLGGLDPYSYQIYDMLASDNSWGGNYCYCRNTKWVKQ